MPKLRMLMVAYDFGTPNPLENPLKLKAILESSEGYLHYLARVGFVTRKPMGELTDQLAPLLGATGGRLMIFEVKPNYNGWLPRMLGLGFPTASRASKHLINLINPSSIERERPSVPIPCAF